ncbi:MAG: hypothetical protein H6Q64_2317, partial [Firmicutes bacterium]|nr:hypothetical protein [Bacillota bacterium]
GSTKVKECHTHRFAGVTFEGILLANGKHKHRFSTNTDFYEDHHHRISGITGVNINVGNGRHIHFVLLRTTMNDNHTHLYRLATLIDNPSGKE